MFKITAIINTPEGHHITIESSDSPQTGNYQVSEHVGFVLAAINGFNQQSNLQPGNSGSSHLDPSPEQPNATDQTPS